MAAVTTTGLQIDTQEQILAGIEADQKANISTKLDVSSSSPIGQVNGIISGKLRELQELAQAVYKANDPDSVEGAAQDALYALTGLTREPATYSVLKAVTVNLNAGVTLPAGSAAHVTGNTEARFLSLTNVTNSGGVPANVTVDFQAEETGPVQANAGTVTVIATPVAGWNSVTNPTDAVPGKEIETAAAFRIRREEELAKPGTSPLNAIEADIAEVEGVLAVIAVQNVEDYTVDGIPPHSVEVIVSDEGLVDDDVLAEAIHNAVAGGIRPHGNTIVSLTDAHGNVHRVGFTRPTEINIWMTISIQYDPELYTPSVSDLLVKEAIAAADLVAGQNVYVNSLGSKSLTVAGVTDFGSVLAGLTFGTQAAANITLSIREIGKLDTSRITVISTPAVP